MKFCEQNCDDADAKLRQVLKLRYSEVDLPQNFKASVHKRIRSVTPTEVAGWSLLDIFNFILKPQTIVLILLISIGAGFGIGYSSGVKIVKKTAESRYIEFVIPEQLR